MVHKPLQQVCIDHMVWEWCKNVWYTSWNGCIISRTVFENDVKMYGTQAQHSMYWEQSVFENDVKMYGTQAIWRCKCDGLWFENDVKMYGTQANSIFQYDTGSLRMM